MNGKLHFTGSSLRLGVQLPLCSRPLSTGGSHTWSSSRTVRFSLSPDRSSMLLGTHTSHPQASLTTATLPGSFSLCHIGILWIAWLSSSRDRMVNLPIPHALLCQLLPTVAVGSWWCPSHLQLSVTLRQKTWGRGEAGQQSWDVRYGLQGWITRIRDRTNYMVSVTTGCRFELRQQSVVTDCPNKPSVSRHSVPTAF